MLSAFGQTDLALHMITKSEFPSYGYWIDHGATTFWELFTPISTEQSSCNHHFFGDILSWFVRNLAGIRFDPDYNGSGTVRIEPHFPESMSFAEAEMKVSYKDENAVVRSKWYRDGEKIVLITSIPNGMKAVLKLDSKWQCEEGYACLHLEGEQEISLIPAGHRNIYDFS